MPGTLEGRCIVSLEKGGRREAAVATFKIGETLLLRKQQRWPYMEKVLFQNKIICT